MNQEERIKLAELIRNNPGLELLCFGKADLNEAVCDIAYCGLDEYMKADDRYYFKSNMSVKAKCFEDLCSEDIEMLEDYLGVDVVDNISEDELFKEFASIKWTPFIYVYLRER